MNFNVAVSTPKPISIAIFFLKKCSAADDMESALEFNGTAGSVFGVRTLCNPSACFEENGCRAHLQVTVGLTHFVVFLHLLGDVLFRIRHFWTVHDASMNENF